MKKSEPGETPSIQKPKKHEHLVFAEAFLRCLNRADAYHEAYPKATRETCYANGSELLRNTEIKAYVDARMAEMTMQPTEILRRMSDMAGATLKPFITVTDEGFVYFDFSHPDAMNYIHLIKKIKSKRTRRLEGDSVWEDELVEVELHDAKDALKELGKNFKLFGDNISLSNPDGSALIPEKDKEADARHDRAISSLADAIGALIPRESAEPDGPVDAAK